MKSNEILNNVETKGYCLFDLPKAITDKIKRINIKSLKDGFHLNINVHMDLLSKTDLFRGINCEIRKRTQEIGFKWNEINLARVVDGGSSERYATHFDSHIYTMVLPIAVPEDDIDLKGQLYIVPNLRSLPSNDFVNVFQKIRARTYRKEENFDKVQKLPGFMQFDLKVGQALIFNGNRSLHGNIANDSKEKRVTFISHYVDPFPNGAGSLVRSFRKLLGIRK